MFKIMHCKSCGVVFSYESESNAVKDYKCPFCETDNNSEEIETESRKYINNKKNAIRKTVRENNLMKIIKHFGIDKQEDMLIEEMSELIKQILKNRRYGFDYDNTLSELADVNVMLEQFYLMHDISEKDLNEKIGDKIYRTLDRVGEI